MNELIIWEIFDEIVETHLIILNGVSLLMLFCMY